MVKSRFPDLALPQTDVLSYMFPGDSTSLDDTPIWMDAEEPSKSLSAESLHGWITRLGAGLEHKGVVPGDVIMICSPNHLFVPVAYLGVIGYGAIFCGLNPTYSTEEMAYQIRQTKPRMVFAHPDVLDKVLSALGDARLPRTEAFLFSEDSCNSIRGVADWRDLLPAGVDKNRHPQWRWRTLDAATAQKRVASINYSSGTTGLPKGVAVSHAAIIANVEQIIFMRDQEQPYQPTSRPQERWVGFLPLYHAYGQIYSIVMALRLRAQVYVMKAFQYDKFLWTIQTYKVTHLQIAPPIMIMLAKRPETARYDLSSVQNVLCGAAPLSKELQNEVTARFNFHISQGWGMTEVTCGGLNMPGGIRDSTGSVGMLHPNCECRLLNEAGQEVGPSEPGEMYYKGPNVCLGYWQNPAATQETISHDGWLRTGDVAVMDEKGWFWIVDRLKEMIKVNGLQVAPAELEAVLLERDDIADAAVVGMHLDHEERPRAYVVLKEGVRHLSERDFQEWVSKRVAKHKRLAGGVVFVAEVPKLASGKIQRKVMREWAKRDAAVLGGVRI